MKEWDAAVRHARIGLGPLSLQFGIFTGFGFAIWIGSIVSLADLLHMSIGPALAGVANWHLLKLQQERCVRSISSTERRLFRWFAQLLSKR